jgi:acetyl-CoA carboxylase biotin carboxyl carrier protein
MPDPAMDADQPEPNHGSPSLLDPEVLRTLLRQVEGSDIEELEISHGDSRVLLRRDPNSNGAGLEVSDLGDLVRVGRRKLDHLPAVPGVPISAPLAGVYYSRPSAEEPPFVQIGDALEKGMVIGLIETMKMYNEVSCDLSGEVVSIAAHDGDLVDAGQPLLYVRPGEEHPA